MSLADRLKRRIAATGPLTVAEYMAACLGDPEDGYYRTRDPLGAAGDFTTAPEISQMFGELIGLWSAVGWREQGRTEPLRLVELGPGRGTLMADALRALRRSGAIAGPVAVDLVETGRALRARQAAALAGEEVAWHDDLLAVPEGPAVYLANEFFDALPIHQLVRGTAGWHERAVAIDPGSGHLAWTVLPTPSPLAVLIDPARAARGRPGEIVELSPAGIAVAAQLGARLATAGGLALVVDYGHAGGLGDTLQAVARHRFADPLATPGEADLTAHVDFAALARAAGEAGARAFGPLDQGVFLRSLGIEARAERLAALRPEAADAVRGALARLIDPDEMGTLFKALALAPADAPAPPAFA